MCNIFHNIKKCEKLIIGPHSPLHLVVAEFTIFNNPYGETTCCVWAPLVNGVLHIIFNFICLCNLRGLAYITKDYNKFKIVSYDCKRNVG